MRRQEFGLSQDLIPLIVSITEGIEAMTCYRPYRPAMLSDRAFMELVNKTETHFDLNAVYDIARHK
ncbi:MAG: hypothetical protein EXS16_01260 [Gemmataceae bacterium]|nr:hypothetical protein [Gemmataceae bacterium]